MTILAMILLATTFTRPMERVNSLDPINSQSVYDSSVIQLLYRTPLEIDYVARPYKLIKGACELPEVSQDGLLYTFKMTKGKEEELPLSASDVVRSLDELRDPKNASPGGWTIKNVKSIELVDDDTFKIRLYERSHVFPWMMAMSSAGIKKVDGSMTGPYKLKSWRKNHEIVFSRRKKTADTFDTIRYLLIADASTQWLMFLKGELDFLSDISRDTWDAIIKSGGTLDDELIKDGITLHSIPSLDIRYIGFNMKDEVLGKNKKLRQALSCAFDFPTWQKFYNNKVDVANGPVPPTVEGSLKNENPYAFNLERAKALLAEAGYKDGIDPKTNRRLVLELSLGKASQETREAGELLASFFDRIGVKLELSFSTWSAFLQSVNEGRVQMYMMGWVGDYPDAENFLQLFHSRNLSPGANHSNYVNDEFDKTFDEAMKCSSVKDRNELWIKCQEILVEDCPWIYTHISKSYSLTRSSVKGYVPGNFPYGQEYHFKLGVNKK